MRWPAWWAWEIELTPHVEKRMEDRGFTEVGLRSMMHRARGLRPDIAEGRWVVETRFGKRRWEVIVEPDSHKRRIVVVTAYAVGS